MIIYIYILYFLFLSLFLGNNDKRFISKLIYLSMSEYEIEKLKQENEELRQELTRLRKAHNELKRYRKKTDLEGNIIDISKIGIEKLLDLFKEFLRTANSNPVVGAVSGLIVTDVLYRMKIIDLGTALGINVLIGTVEGSQIAGTIIQDLTEITQFFGKRPANLEFTPSAHTVVYAENSSNEQLIRSLMAREGLQG